MTSFWISVFYNYIFYNSEVVAQNWFIYMFRCIRWTFSVAVFNQSLTSFFPCLILTFFSRMNILYLIPFPIIQYGWNIEYEQCLVRRNNNSIDNTKQTYEYNSNSCSLPTVLINPLPWLNIQMNMVKATHAQMWTLSLSCRQDIEHNIYESIFIKTY